MIRYLALATFLFFGMAVSFSQGGAQKAKAKEKDKDIEVKATLTKDDPKDAKRGGPSQSHMVRLKKGKTYTIDMVSSEVDSFLRLHDPKGTELAEDDDSGGDLNSRIIFACNADGEYKIVCTTFGGDMKGGAYTLTVKVSGAATTPTSAHTQMIGKDAPALSADFAVNGTPRKLADFKGKVVLLHFFDIRSSESAKLQEELAKWKKKYNDKGLTIVGVTFYTSDINQNLGFNPETGAVTTVTKADRKSDQALIKAYANYNKIDHLLLALPKKEAETVYDAYGVNGTPQVVVIDRKGSVRLIDVGGAKSADFVEIELKKVLGDK
ncbi:MAG TPA: redoxin domain-containing protein [Gemmataceae bacterium]|nr:redoxin domain-containing protein [Gemmataceae bacterium]